jgi:hypothetical protein
MMKTNPIADLTNAMVVMLKKLEGVISIGGIYDDLKAGEHNPTIGLGINLNATVSGTETLAQRNARYELKGPGSDCFSWALSIN